MVPGTTSIRIALDLRGIERGRMGEKRKDLEPGAMI
ncbi:hypothetical protein COLO4_04294 [Corchorus olitorius]|uniref:Uncharacterized protein n=1 Tax=Corchorus olitorius TaxID=93759 RepID=A0A1R3KUN3_9ROSI|nr:hypothetical protein COLO4_04294 [Corchorus olitorius]